MLTTVSTAPPAGPPPWRTVPRTSGAVSFSGSGCGAVVVVEATGAGRGGMAPTITSATIAAPAPSSMTRTKAISVGTPALVTSEASSTPAMALAKDVPRVAISDDEVAWATQHAIHGLERLPVAW